MTTAQLNVAVKRNGKILLSVGGYGLRKEVNMADLISLCVRRARTNITS